MEIVLHHPTVFWLILGAALIIFEALTMPGIGLFLAGLGALVTGILVKAGLIEGANIIGQWAWFFGLTTLWVIILWKSLMKFRTTRGSSQKFTNVIGETAIAGKEGLAKGRVGQVSWSGTLMRAELDASVLVDFVPPDTQVEIKAVSGTTLIVIPK